MLNNMNVFFIIISSCFLSFALMTFSFLQVQVRVKELQTEKKQLSGGLAGRLPTLFLHLLALGYWPHPRHLGCPVAGQPLPAPAWGLAVRPVSRHAQRLPEATLGPQFRGGWRLWFHQCRRGRWGRCAEVGSPPSRALQAQPLWAEDPPYPVWNGTVVSPRPFRAP